jgi:hypothetical protein
MSKRERSILSAFIVLTPLSIWTTCKGGSGFNSLLFAYLTMTALFVARLDALFDWLASLSIHRSFVAAATIALALVVSFFLQFDRAATLLSLRHGDEKYDVVVSIARRLQGIVVAPQDPTIAYRAKQYFGRSLFFELDAHAINGNWPRELPMSVLQEIRRANAVVVVNSYVPTAAFERSLPQNGFHQVSFPELQDSAYTIWSKNSE